MKTLLVIPFLCTLSHPAFARLEMLIVDQASPTNTIEVRTNEVASLSKFYVFSGTGAEAALVVQVGQHSVLSGCSGCSAIPLPIKGPSRISLVSRDPLPGAQWFAYALIQVTPESFPPDKTIVIPEGGGANIALECSTNLIDWTTAPLGVYTNQPTVKFFRLKAERLP